jgi:5-methylcytosine-specific restriction endonuclease McrA
MSDKTCTKCQTSKIYDDFHRDRTRKDGYFPQCKTCTRLYRQSEHGARLHREGNLRFQQTPKGKACLRRAQSKYQQSPKGRLMYQQAARRRLARIADADMSLTDDDIRRVHEKFNHKCFNCGNTERLEIDHHYPLSMGFGLTEDNAVLLCRSCNASKGNRMPEDFYPEEKLRVLVSVI